MSPRAELTAVDMERRERRKNWSAKRPKGSIPPLTDEILDDVEWLRDWVTASLRPRDGWRVLDFKHGEDLDTPCTIVVANGTDRAGYRFRSQRELTTSPTRLRVSLASIAGGQLRPPQLTTGELGDVYQALCALGPALAGVSEPEQAKEWLFRLLDDAKVLEGHSLTAGAAEQRDALIALKRWGEFTYLDALTIRKDPESPWPRRPVALVDRQSGEMWLRARESATYLRHILDVRIRYSTLQYRWEEIGVEYRYFQSRQRHAGDPHPKAHLYRVPRAARAADEAL